MEVGEIAIATDDKSNRKYVVQITSRYKNNDLYETHNPHLKKMEWYFGRQLSKVESWRNQPYPEPTTTTPFEWRQEILIISPDRDSSEPGKRLRAGNDITNSVIVETVDGSVKEIPKDHVVPLLKSFSADVVLSFLQYVKNPMNFLNTIRLVNKDAEQATASNQVWKYMLWRDYRQAFLYFYDYQTRGIHENVAMAINYYTSNVDKRGSFQDIVETRGRSRFYKRFYEFLTKLQTRSSFSENLINLTASLRGYSKKAVNLSHVFQCGKDIFVLFSIKLVTQTKRFGNFLYRSSNENLEFSGDPADIIVSNQTAIQILGNDQNGFVYMNNESIFQYYDCFTRKNIILSRKAVTSTVVFKPYQKCWFNKTCILVLGADDVWMIFHRQTGKLLLTKEREITTRDGYITGEKEIIFDSRPNVVKITVSEDGILTEKETREKFDYNQHQIPEEESFYNNYIISSSSGKIFSFKNSGKLHVYVYELNRTGATGFDIVSCQICGDATEYVCNTCRGAFCSEQCFNDDGSPSSLKHLCFF